MENRVISRRKLLGLGAMTVGAAVVGGLPIPAQAEAPRKPENREEALQPPWQSIEPSNLNHVQIVPNGSSQSILGLDSQNELSGRSVINGVPSADRVPIIENTKVIEYSALTASKILLTRRFGTDEQPSLVYYEQGTLPLLLSMTGESPTLVEANGKVDVAGYIKPLTTHQVYVAVKQETAQTQEESPSMEKKEVAYQRNLQYLQGLVAGIKAINELSQQLDRDPANKSFRRLRATLEKHRTTEKVLNAILKDAGYKDPALVLNELTQNNSILENIARTKANEAEANNFWTSVPLLWGTDVAPSEVKMIAQGDTIHVLVNLSRPGDNGKSINTCWYTKGTLKHDNFGYYVDFLVDIGGFRGILWSHVPPSDNVDISNAEMTISSKGVLFSYLQQNPDSSFDPRATLFKSDGLIYDYSLPTPQKLTPDKTVLVNSGDTIGLASKDSADANNIMGTFTLQSNDYFSPGTVTLPSGKLQEAALRDKNGHLVVDSMVERTDTDGQPLHLVTEQWEKAFKNYVPIAINSF